MQKKEPNTMALPSIIFMGTPDFAVPTLKMLHKSPFNISLVVTQPDRPKGRGRNLTPPPVKKAALEMELEVYQPDDIRDPIFIKKLRQLAPDFLVVIAFGQILSKSILEVPLRGAINVHASLLPKYRGPAPIQWAIIRGEDTSGVTTMLMDHGVDTGDMLLHEQTPVKNTDTAATLHDRLSHMGAQLLIKTIEGILQGTVFPRAQKHQNATYAPMLKKENGRIEWHHTAASIDAQIRAMTPWPGAYCELDGKRIKIHKAKCIESDQTDAAPGAVVPGFPDELRVATGDGLISILEIQGASGKRMPIKQFLHGNPIIAGAIFT